MPPPPTADRPVRWTQSVRNLAAQGVTAFFECGPGEVLAGLNKRIAKELATASLQDAAGLEKAVALLKPAEAV